MRYLREAAEALDLMNEKHDLQHLDVKPHNLFLVSNHVKVADFGLVKSLATRPSRAPASGRVTPLYAAPETFAGQAQPVTATSTAWPSSTRSCSPGTRPFDGKNIRQLLLQHTQAEPNLASLLGDRSADRGAGAGEEPRSSLSVVHGDGAGAARRGSRGAASRRSDLDIGMLIRAGDTQTPPGDGQPSSTLPAQGPAVPPGGLSADYHFVE